MYTHGGHWAPEALTPGLTLWLSDLTEEAGLGMRIQIFPDHLQFPYRQGVLKIVEQGGVTMWDPELGGGGVLVAEWEDG